MTQVEQERTSEFLPQVILSKHIPYDIGGLLWAVDTDRESILKESHRIDPAYDRWQRVRHPYGLTGFEGYFVGSDMTAQQIAQAIAEIGKTVMSHLPREIRKVYCDSLTGEKPNLSAIMLFSQEFGAVLGRLRAQAGMNNRARNFHDDLVARCTMPIEYELDASGIIQRLVLPQISSRPNEIETPSLGKEAFDPSHPYGVMSLIGRVGHPTVRTLLGHIPREDEARLMRQNY